MSGKDPIRRLGELYGIDPSYTDFWGKRRRVLVATERALLEAMGAAVGSEREIVDSLREVEARPWRRLLAPVRVIAPPEPVEVTFSLPARLGGATIDWTLCEETGPSVETSGFSAKAETESDTKREKRKSKRKE